MKTLKSIAFLIGFSLISAFLHAQSLNANDPVIPYRIDRSFLFGNDVVIKNEPYNNQRQPIVCSAFNGWLYSAYTYIDSISSCVRFNVLKSENNGLTWTLLINQWIPSPYKSLTSFDIEAIGDSLSNLKLVVAWVSSSSENPQIGGGNPQVWIFNGVTGDYENYLLDVSSATCIALASDYPYPATNSDPHSLCIIYSDRFVWAGGIDTLFLCTSSDGGHTLDSRKVIATSSNIIHKVDIAYGRSFSKNSGRYYAVWEEKSSWSSSVGHIYTAHSEPNFNSPFTKPVKLDSIDASALNNGRFPVIACQYNNTDNDSSNITEMILFDKYIPAENRYDIAGFYNMHSTSSGHFTPFTINSTLDYKMNPSVAFNPVASKFMVTYYDSTSNKLPFLQHDFNMTDPNNWEVSSSGYNDSQALSWPEPKVVYNSYKQQGMNVWSSDGQNTNGIALFDAPYLVTGIPSNDLQGNDLQATIFPNPCKTSFSVSFCLKESGHVSIAIYDLFGQPRGIIADQEFQSGSHELNCNAADLAAGTYLVRIQSGKACKTFKFAVVN